MRIERWVENRIENREIGKKKPSTQARRQRQQRGLFRIKHKASAAMGGLRHRKRKPLMAECRSVVTGE